MSLNHGSILRLYFKQLLALLWKCVIIRRVHFISTFFEILGPVLMLLAFAIIYNKAAYQGPGGAVSKAPPVQSLNDDGLAGPQIYHNPIMTVQFHPRLDFTSHFRLLYAPPIPDAKQLFKLLLSFNSTVEIISFDDAESLENGLHNATAQSKLNAVGIYFEQLDLQLGIIRHVLYVPGSPFYVNRASTNLYPPKNGQDPSYVDFISFFDNTLRVISYVHREFISQFASNRGTNHTNITQLSWNRMPYPVYKRATFTEFSIYDFVAAFMVLTYIILCPLIVKRITDEKATKSKELLRLVGMSDSVFWCAHFINYFVIIVVHAAPIAAILFGFPVSVFYYSSPSLLMFLFVLFGIQTILFSMLLSTLFNRPIVAVIVTVIVWLATLALIFRFYIPSVNREIDVEATNTARILTCFLPTGSLVWMLSLMGAFENTATGLHWYNLGTTTSTYFSLTEITVILAVISSYFLYAFLIWYLDNVWPFQFGVAKSPIFLFMPSYWCPVGFDKKDKQDSMPKLNEETHEPDPVGLTPSIQIEDVCKTFKSKMAVNHLWLNIFRNQITVLLGHNGAGKSTTMNMITGMFRSSSGSIYVNGFNVFTQTKQARRNIGLCPQENIIFNELTVAQHLKLYALLKNFPYFELHQEVSKVLELLHLTDKTHVLASNLSGGMKRKLALGIAMVGGSEILILDEPTSGMDPEARRIIWDMLIGIRRKRTILLTTHYMEEADILGDRIAIMNEGKLSCSGSPFFLKNVFGTGYQLRIEKLAHFNVKQFEHFLQRYISSATFKSEIETEVLYSFAHKATDKSNLVTIFPKLFQEIEANREQLGINSCGLSYSTLEDVFLRVGSETANLIEGNSEANVLQNEQIVPKKKIELCSKTELLSGWHLLVNQIWALVIKRLHFARRYWVMFIFQLIIPSIIIIVAMKLDAAIRALNSRTYKEIELDLVKLYGTGTQAFYAGPEKLKKAYEEMNEQLFAKVHQINNSHFRNFESEILDASTNLDTYIRKIIYGLEVNKNNAYHYRLWYNHEQIFSAPLSLSVAMDTFLRLASPPELQKYVTIETTIKPIVADVIDQGNIDYVNLIISWIITCLVMLPIAFPFLAAAYVLYPIREQYSKSKLLQLMAGLSPITFWIINFIFDLVYHFIAISIMYLLIFLVDTDQIFFGIDSKASGTILYLILIAFGFASIPLAYATSYFLRQPSSGFVFLVILNLVFGLISNILMSMLDFIDNFLDLNVFPWTFSFLYLLRIVPIFSMLFGYQKLYKLSTFSRICHQVPFLEFECAALKSHEDYTLAGLVLRGCCPELCGDKCFSTGSPWTMGMYGSGTEVIYLIVSGLFYLTVIIMFEYYKQPILRWFSTVRLLRWLKRKKLKKPKVIKELSTPIPEDSDVVHERQRTKLSMKSDIIAVHELTRLFDEFTAVDHLTFGVKHHECFGLLGVNGAGKTTTFSMLTGDLLPTSGDAIINGMHSLMGNLSEFRKHIGYCPQFDALIDRLTGEETLFFYARLRGVPPTLLQRDVSTLIQMVGLEAHATKLTHTYSGGTKRKLSLAIALVGNPPLIFLDEPTAGVDPSARRKIWNTLGLVRSNFRSSIILTSHSMEECEALCSRIAIMVSGKFRCLGSTQHLRTKYGQGYSILIRLKREHESNTLYCDLLQREIARQVPSAVLKDYHQCLMSYHVTDPSESWSDIFTKMAQLDEKYHLEDYVISDTTLESIFIMFARSQHTRHTS